jgi:3-hydroxyisobutyrate dehydrogenase
VTPARPTLGFIGTGLMGGPIAQALLEAGYPLQVWNRSENKTAALVGAGAKAAASPAELTSASEIVFTCVTDAPAVEAVVFGEDGIAKAAHAGQVLVDHSSIRPAASREMAALLRRETGMGWIDAPVSGGAPGVRARTLVVMAGGAADDFARVEPVIRSYAGRVTLMGSEGAGQTTKLVNQALCGIGFVAVAEACRLAQNAGVEAGRIPDCLAGGRADSRLLQEYMPKMAADDATVLGRLATLVKDLDAVHEVAAETGTPMPLTMLALELHRILTAKGRGDEDPSALLKLYGPDG